MEWVNAIQSGVSYIEEHMNDDICPGDIADHVHMSSFYFQKGFSMLCGYTVMEYVRNRRLSLAAADLCNGNMKVIDAAFKYGYESPDSFTKAFTRFHGISPSLACKGNGMIKTFAPLQIEISLKGGYLMDYRIEKKESFRVLAVSKQFGYENCKQEIPMFWKEHYEKGNGKYVCGEYGINIAEQMGKDSFEYLIADTYKEGSEVPEGFEVRTIPAFTWAVFPSIGPLPETLQKVNIKIFSEWLPAEKEYEFAAGYCVEMYDDPCKYENGTKNDKYYAEIWIPVKTNKQ